MSEIRSVVSGATSKSLVLVDEICRGTETAKGTCIAGSILETLDQIGCMGVVSTHLHGIFDLPLATKNTVHKAMGTEIVDGRIRPTWKLIDGVCRESLAFETARREGIPETIIRRAEELYLSINVKADSKEGSVNIYHTNSIGEDYDSLITRTESSVGDMKLLQKEVESAVTIICQKKLIELYKKKITSELAEVFCFAIGVREQPPPSTVGTSSIYILFRPDKKLYVGQVTFPHYLSTSLFFSPHETERIILMQTDDLAGRIHAHRSKEGMKNAVFLYVIVPGKSIASQLETLLINQLPLQGFRLTNKADGKHRNFGATSTLNLEALSLHH